MDLWNLDEGWVSGIWESQFTECREIPFEYETVIDNVPLLNSVLVDVSYSQYAGTLVFPVSVSFNF